MTPVVIHYHIFKNAGTSLDHSLQQSFGDSWASFEGDHAHDVLSGDKLADFLVRNPHIRAVSSHLARPPLPGPHCLPLIMLRHPIDRARAVYQYVRRTPSAFGHTAACQGFPAYVLWCLDTPGGDVVIRNYQTIHLSDASFRAAHILDTRAIETDLLTAKDILNACPAFGLVREFAQSCSLFEACYQPLLPELTLYDVRENASPDGAPDEARSIEASRAELGDSLFARLSAENSLDLALYEYAAAIFDQRKR